MMTEPQKFRKKPVTIEAMQWEHTEECLGALMAFCWRPVEGMGSNAGVEQFMFLDDHTPTTLTDNEIEDFRFEGCSAVVYDELHFTWIGVREHDWIIKGIQGEFYPCKPDIFAKSYEAVNGDD